METVVPLGLLGLGFAFGVASVPFGSTSMSLLDRIGYVRSGLENENERLG